MTASRRDDEPLAGYCNLNDAINAIFRVGLVLSGTTETLHTADKSQIQRAVEEMDQIIHDIRQAAFDNSCGTATDPSRTGTWLTRMQEATTSINDVLHTSTCPSTTTKLAEATQVAAVAISALDQTQAPTGRPSPHAS